jgi:ElaB/YqjD/DUF883 family membrane-anchored ribosome-binding protein
MERAMQGSVAQLAGSSELLAAETGHPDTQSTRRRAVRSSRREEAAMTIGNGTTKAHHMIDEQFASFKAKVHDAVDRAEATTESARSKLRAYTARATEMIKAHPLAAVGIAFGVGYVIVRLARR